MLRKFGCALLCASTLFSTHALAMTHTMSPGVSIDYSLQPGQPETLVNYWFWSIKATCVVTGEDPSNDIYAVVLNKQGTINGKPLSMGQDLLMTVHPGDKLFITAESGAKVELTNRGEHTVIAHCSTST